MLRGSHTHHCDVVGTSSCDTLVLCFVAWDELFEYEVYEGLRQSSSFSDTSTL
jgi:hypothetical protein